MRYHREWTLPVGDNWAEALDKPEGWGQSYFWYCRRCKAEYATAELLTSDGSLRIWRAVSGICHNCPGDKWTIPGSLEDGALEDRCLGVYAYQLNQELRFYFDAQHPRHGDNYDPRA